MGTEKELSKTSKTFVDICKTWNQLIEEEKIMERKEILEYLEKTELFSKTDLRNADNMLNNNQSVPINELAERFIKIDKEFSGRPWNILQILSQINMIVPMEDRKCAETETEEFQKTLLEEDKIDKAEILKSLENYKTSGMKEFVDNWFEKSKRGLKIMEIKGATLLSVEEATTFLTKSERKYKDWWWLRSPGFELDRADGVNRDGSVFFHGDFVNRDDGCVRPALIIDLTSSDYKVGETFVFGDKTFKIISDKLAFCLGDIGKHYFRDDWDAADANDYKSSDVKKFVDAWFEEAVKERKSQEQKSESFNKEKNTMRFVKLPNLELVQYKAESVLRELNQLAEFPEYDIDCFSQIWGSTCTGFDKTKEGMPLAGGSAMTKEYTTVVHELTSDIYIVFFGDRMCYKVEKATKEFLKDLKDRNLKPLSEALVKY